MKVCLLDGSPKKKDSASGWFLNELKKLLPKGTETTVLQAALYKGEPFLEELCQCDALVIAFPLYVDAAPGHLLRILTELESFAAERDKKPLVYGMVNSGFFESSQNRYALEVMHHFCRRAEFPWGQGLAIGGGGFLGQSVGIPLEAAPKKSLGKAMAGLASAVAREKSGEDQYVEPNLPKLFYHCAVNHSWKREGKQNGLNAKDLNRGWEREN